MKNNTEITRFNYVSPLENSIYGEPDFKNVNNDLYINRNLKTRKNGKTVTLSSRTVIESLKNAYKKHKLLAAEKNIIAEERIIEYTFKIQLEDNRVSIIRIEIPQELKNSVYSDVVFEDMLDLETLTVIGREEHKSNRTNKIIAALIGLGIALGTAYSFKTAIEYEKEEHAHAGDKLRSEYSFMDDREYDEMIQKGKEAWKMGEESTVKTYAKK